MTLQVVPLREAHLEDAAALASARYRGFRDRLPLLPPQYAEAAAVLPLLRDMTRSNPGVAAIRQGRLVGFLTAWRMSSFRGRPAAFAPELAHAAKGADGRRIVEEMYTHLAAAWVRDGYRTHLLSVLADGRGGLDVWHWLGFAMIAADALRDLQPLPAAGGRASVRRGGPGDIAAAMDLGAALQRHMAAAPTFLSHKAPPARRGEEEWLADPAHALWLGYDGTEAVAFLKQGPANPDACMIIADEGTSSIVGAYTRADVRGRGMASALLDRALEWARTAGYTRCAVDFEPMNPTAARFWLQHFCPVCYTLARHVDEGGGYS